jgi:hypothetical protein
MQKDRNSIPYLLSDMEHRKPSVGFCRVFTSAGVTLAMFAEFVDMKVAKGE